MPRTYRGRDIFWWLRAGGCARPDPSDVDDLARARRVPSPQLVGSASHGVARSQQAPRPRRPRRRPAGGASPTGAPTSPGRCANMCALADLKLERLLHVFDDVGRAGGARWRRRPRPASLRADSGRRPCRRSSSICAGGEFGTVLWATGYRPDYSWLDLPVLDRKGTDPARRRRRHRRPGLLRTRPQLLPPPRFELHLGSRGRHRRSRRPPATPSRPRVGGAIALTTRRASS